MLTNLSLSTLHDYTITSEVIIQILTFTSLYNHMMLTTLKFHRAVRLSYIHIAENLLLVFSVTNYGFKMLPLLSQR